MSNGIIRKIDDLGRIVVPKELRKKLKIGVGDYLDIENKEDKIILSKYTLLNNIDTSFNKIIKIIEDLTNDTVIITDRYKVIITNDSKKDKYLEQPISGYLKKIMDIDKPIVEYVLNDIEIIEGLRENASYVIKNIKLDGDIVGLFIMLNNDKKIEDSSLIISTLVSSFISN